MQSRWPATRLVATYVIFAAAWVLGSDWLTGLLPQPIEESMQTVKGLAFVTVTGLVLYVLVQRMHDDVSAGARQARAAEVLLRQVIDTVPVGVLFVNDEAVITFMNPGAESLLSISAADGVGRRLDELCCSGSPDTAARVNELLRTGSVHGLPLKSPDDSEARAFVARARAVDPEAEAGGWVVALADITESHRAGERMSRLVDGYRFLASSLRLCGKANDPAGLLRQVAEAAVEHGGYRAAWATLRAPDGTYEDAAVVGLGEHAAETARHLRTQALEAHDGAVDSLLGTSVTVSNDIARDPANPWYPVAEEGALGAAASFGVAGGRGGITLFAALPGHFDAEQVELLGELQGTLSFTFEKMELDRQRCAAEEALERSEQAYRELFVAHPMPLWVYDRETLRFLAVNNAAVSKYGWSREEFLGMTIAEIRPPRDVGALVDNVARVMGGFEDAGIWTHVDKSGRSFPVHIMSHATEWDGHAAEIVMAEEVARMG